MGSVGFGTIVTETVFNVCAKARNGLGTATEVEERTVIALEA